MGVKNKKRRWCSMQVSGSRAKAAAHRAKKKG
ncbi:MAG: CGNR zinc finger domain-containing protein [Oceanobacter sp.]